MELAINGPYDRREKYPGHRIGVPLVDVVLERSLIECHGGVQAFYQLRRRGKDAEVTVMLTENELVSHAEYVEVIRQLVVTGEEATKR